MLMTDAIEILLQIGVFVGVALLTIVAFRNAERALSLRRRLGDERGTATAATGNLIKDDSVSNPFLQWVETASLNDPGERDKLRRDLTLAGFPHPAAPMFYVLFRFGMAISLPVLFIISQTMSAKPMQGAGPIVIPLLLCGAGLVMPRSLLDRRVHARKEELEHEFPDVLDLLVVCVEAGLSLEAAFVRVGQEVAQSHPRMAREFAHVSHEMGAGRTRSDALRGMADRTEVDTIKSFVALMIQTDALGVSIAQTLRTFSIEMRQTRLLRAEEKAMRIPVLMTIPLVACILPVIVTSLLLPAMIDVVRNLLPALRGQI
jgi:tight adherence protein C